MFRPTPLGSGSGCGPRQPGGCGYHPPGTFRKMTMKSTPAPGGGVRNFWREPVTGWRTAVPTRRERVLALAAARALLAFAAVVAWKRADP